VSKYKELILYADVMHRQFANIMRLTYLTVLHIIMQKVSNNIEFNVITYANANCTHYESVYILRLKSRYKQ